MFMELPNTIMLVGHKQLFNLTIIKFYLKQLSFIEIVDITRLSKSN